ncbi:hypothetical protein ABT246_41195 [Streptomyces sp. NPDC001553]|uniref:hypothetical protein n=2 Tax=unclassified Streptomyces TaxID=2593676 RepID=UPI0033297359
MKLHAVLAGDHVRLPESALLPADSAPQGIIPAAVMRDADPDASPPEIRTVSGETVFVSAERRTELERFCIDNRIPRRSRPDVWGDLLEPFLDTEFTTEHQAAAQARLDQVGLGPDEVAGIRHKVAPLMRAYNTVHEDWHHLGLADLLDAATADWIPEDQQIRPSEVAAFCAWAMRIADLGYSRRTAPRLTRRTRRAPGGGGSH